MLNSYPTKGYYMVVCTEFIVHFYNKLMLSQLRGPSGPNFEWILLKTIVLFYCLILNSYSCLSLFFKNNDINLLSNCQKKPLKITNFLLFLDKLKTKYTQIMSLTYWFQKCKYISYVLIFRLTPGWIKVTVKL